MLSETNGGQLGTERVDAVFYFADRFSGGFTVAADVVPQLFLVHSRDPFQAGQTECEGEVLQERRNIVFESYFSFHKTVSCAFHILLHFSVAFPEILLGLLHRSPGPYYAIRILFLFNINRIPPILTSFKNCCYVHSCYSFTPDRLSISATVPRLASSDS